MPDNIPHEHGRWDCYPPVHRRFRNYPVLTEEEASRGAFPYPPEPGYEEDGGGVMAEQSLSKACESWRGSQQVNEVPNKASSLEMIPCNYGMDVMFVTKAQVSALLSGESALWAGVNGDEYTQVICLLDGDPESEWQADREE